MSDRRVAILGAGRLGESMLRGFLSSGWREPGEIVVTSAGNDTIEPDELAEESA